MDQDLKDLALMVAGVFLAKALDIAWDIFERQRGKRKTPRTPGKHSKRS